MIAHAIFFYTFSLIAVVSAIMVTASKNTVHSVFFLILDFISISCLFIMIGAEFLGMIMLIVYVGAVAVLFLFVVMMLNVSKQTNTWFESKSGYEHIPIGMIISLILTESVGVTAGGLIVPGYIALNLHSPAMVLTTFGISLFTLAILNLSYRVLRLKATSNGCR